MSLSLSYCQHFTVYSPFGHLSFVAEHPPKEMRSKIRIDICAWSKRFEAALRAEPPPQGGTEEVKANLPEAGRLGQTSRMYITLFPPVENLRGAACSATSLSQSVNLSVHTMLHHMEVALALFDEGAAKKKFKKHYDVLQHLLQRQHKEDVTDEVLL